MATTLDYINQLKEDKKNLVEMLNSMGVEASDSDTFTSLTPKVGKIVTDPILQDKNIEITENGTTTITADEGYNGLNNVQVTTNVAGSGGGEVAPNYVSDGLIAWFDESEPIDENEQWHSKVGDDYISVFSRLHGNNQTNPVYKEKNQPLQNNCIFTFMNNADYYKKGYTIELVGKLNYQNGSSASGGWLITFNMGTSPGVGFRTLTSSTTTNGYVNYINDGNSSASDDDFLVDLNKYFGTSFCLSDIGARNNTYKQVVKASIHGREFKTITQNSATSHGTKNSNNVSTFLCYYTDTVANSTYRASGCIRCIRVYDRELTNEEIATNHAIDVARFNLEK